MRVLWVLMWKHAVGRLRKFILTFVEITCPLTFFIFLCILKLTVIDLFIDILSKPDGDSMAKSEKIPITNIEPRPYWLMYTPESKHTDSLMDDVGAKLNLKRLSSNPDYKQQGYLPLPKEYRVVEIAPKMKTHQALLIFNGDLSGDKMPKRLNYSIRMKGDFRTNDQLRFLKNSNNARKTYKFQYGTFMMIQWAVDTSFIHKKTDKDITQNLFIQAFPQFGIIKNMGIEFVIVLLQFVCFLSLILSFVFQMSRLLQERASGIQELMKMVGVSTNTLGFCHFLNVLPVGVIFAAGGAIACKVTGKPLVPKTDGFIIFLMLLLYFNSVIALAFVCSYISSGTQYAVTLSALTYFLSFVPPFYLSSRKMKYIWRLLKGLLPHSPMLTFWSDVGSLELTEKGVYFSNIKEKISEEPSVLIGFLSMLLQTLICYVIAWYLSLVRPGQYGQALPWNFLCKRRSNRAVGLDEDEQDLIYHDKQYFEPGPPHTEAGIKVINVSKVYPKRKVLNKVSLEVYKGEITLLLGHNGAGKTTLMSIITGLTSATEGSVLVNGKDTVRQKSEVRKNIGFCPQNNLYFNDLTLRQHIMFFTMLKRGSYSEAKLSASQLAERLGLSNKLDSLISQLSGGMKRRAQLACALAGGADVLVLDEPTSGLDVETRRGLWDLLLSLRGERTVLLTTHFMEEADALGDRVAALSGGVLKCFATPMHLKKAVGTGYRLSLITNGKPKVEAITEEVTSHVPDATLKEQTNNSLSYTLPAAHSGQFSKLFAALEAKRSKLRIDSIGVGVSTLEEVFLKLCSEIDTSLYEDKVENDRRPELPPEKIKGISLYLRQFYVLLKRQFKYAMYRKWVFLILYFIIPITVICLLMGMQIDDPATKTEKPKSRALVMNLEQFNNPHIVLLRLKGPHVTQSDVMKLNEKWGKKLIFQKSNDVAKTALEYSKTDEYIIVLGGVEVDENEFKVGCNPMQRHAAPIALNLLSNLLAVHNIPSSDGNSIITINDPIAREISDDTGKKPKNLEVVTMWGFCLILVILAVNIINISLPCQERLTGARHIHIMSGCPIELHWLATLSFHMTICTLGLIVPTILAVKFLEKDKTFNQPDTLGTLTLILFLGCMSFLAFSYLVSLHFSERVSSIFLVVCVVICVTTTAPSKVLIEAGGELKNFSLFDKMLFMTYGILSYTVTPHVITETALRCLNVGRINAWCDHVKDNCPALRINDPAFDIEKCCADEKPRCYFCIDKFSPGEGMILLLVHFLVLMTLVIMTERRVFNGLIDKVMNIRYKPTQPAEQDDMVRAEKAYVSGAITLPTDRIPDAMLVDDLHKNYVPLCSKNVNALKGISFSVKKGECFGLLGVNGAGKSTCFKMITAEVCPTRGKIFSNGFFLRRGNSQYLQTLGYCPQFFGLDMFQTGEDNLAMVLTLRGFDEQHVKQEVSTWLQIVGLEKYARQRVEGYSGGCVRRLGTASALCGSAELALLDEPTAGVDVVARRRLWTALRKGLRSQRSVVITSHSMDEMEALCSRIAILAGGRVRALGTAAALRAAHAQGHAVIFKIKHVVPEGEVDGAKTQVNKLKGQLQQMFNCTLKDEHKTMLHYHINETLSYSTLFAELEALHQDFPDLIEDYSVTETTLEEVFLSFAKEQHTSSRQAV